MSKERMKMSEKEKFMAEAIEHAEDAKMFNMNEYGIDAQLDKEASRKLNNEIEKFEETMTNQKAKVDKIQDELDYDIEQAEIKPLFSRILVKPYEVNPFQKLKIEKGIIVDAAGYNPHVDKNPQTGKYEEQDQFIQCGEIVEAGPACDYVQDGDVVFYRKDTTLPVPFLNWGLVTINENQILAVVNVGLTERFENVKLKLK